MSRRALIGTAAAILIGVLSAGAWYLIGPASPITSDGQGTESPAPLADDEGILEGTVVDADGNPLPGATVLFEPLDRPRDEADARDLAYQTGSDGAFQRRLRAGEYEITATLEPDSTATETTTVEAGQTAEVELTLHPSE